MNYTKEKWIAVVVAIVVVALFFGGLFAYKSQQKNADLLDINSNSGQNSLDSQNTQNNMQDDQNKTDATTTDGNTTKVTGKTQTSADGLVIQDSVVGTGATATVGHSVTVNYTGMLENGTVFDSSFSRNQPFTFDLGAGQVIKGWDEGVAGMKVGGKRRLTIPASLGYGAQGAGGGAIPPNSTLVFDVELVSVK